MPVFTAKISIAIDKTAGAIRVVGRADLASSQLFCSALKGLRKQNHRALYVFLESCLLMDSTFLGVLASQGDAFFKETNRRIALVQPSDRVKKLIDNLGVLSLFDVLPSLPNREFVFHEIHDEPPMDRNEITRMSIKAHEDLIQLNKDNRLRFEGVLDLLKGELSKSKCESS